MSAPEQAAPGGYSPTGYSPTGYSPTGYSPTGYALIGGGTPTFDAGGTPIAAEQARPDQLQQIEAHLGELDAVAELPLAEHAEAFQRVHAGLQAALAEIDGA